MFRYSNTLKINILVIGTTVVRIARLVHSADEYNLHGAQNSAFSFSNKFIFQLFVIVFTCVGPFPERAEHICRRLRKLTSNINLFQLKGQDLALSNDMHIFLQMTSIRSAILNSARGV